MTGSWSITGEAREIRRSAERNAILALLRAKPEVLWDVTEVADEVGKPKPNVRRLLSKMARDGEIHRPTRGTFCYAKPVPPSEAEGGGE